MPISEEQILSALSRVIVPGTKTDLVRSGAIKDLAVDGADLHLTLVVESSDPGASKGVRSEAERVLSSLDGVENVHLKIHTMLPTAAPAPEPPPTWADRIPGIRRVIAVASGKGGVGKSTVAANLALALAGAGRQVGLLDADIYGPSQQLMMGANEAPVGAASGKIRPVTAPGGVSVMSFGFIVDADQPVIWRGPMLMKALEQFVGDVEWGDLDFLVVDLPPGTGDVALTLCQNVPLAGAIIVTTPQDVALIDARKSLHMFNKLGVPVLGIVENMSHFECPSCGHVEHIFGSGGGQRTAESLSVPFLGSIPLDPMVVAGGDNGRPVVLERPESLAAKAFAELARRAVQTMEGEGA